MSSDERSARASRSPKRRAAEELPGAYKRAGANARDEAESLADQFLSFFRYHVLSLCTFCYTCYTLGKIEEVQKDGHHRVLLQIFVA